MNMFVNGNCNNAMDRLVGEVKTGKHVMFKCNGALFNKPKICDLSRITSFNAVGKGDKLVVLVTSEQAKKCYLPAHAPKEGQKYFVEERGFIAQSTAQKAASMQHFFVLMTGEGAQEFFKTAAKPRFTERSQVR
ncbi:MAG TPA: hypothetical protein PLO51_03405 [Candidatus Micrarchaeota archaeon]|nr:hypothetical protein [Candidatus Micrarchaeota archaeon]